MRRKILVVEDDPANREMFTTLLSNEGYTVVCAEDGFAGLSQARKENPHLILTDLCMPDLNGVEMIKTLRAQPETSNVPIIACTAYASGIMASEALNAGANHAVYKPVEFGVLLTLIASLLSETVAISLFLYIAADAM